MRWRLMLFAIGCAIALPTVALAGTEQPEYRYHGQLRDMPVFIDTTSCPGFGPAELALNESRFAWQYVHFAGTNGDIFGEEEGWTDLDARGTADTHSYRLHERYVFPRAFREFVSGYAYTVIKRDDGATLEGDAVLVLNVLVGLGREEINWTATPTCSL